MKKLFRFCSVLIVLLLCMGLTSACSRYETPVFESTNSYGNNTANLNTWCSWAVQDEYIVRSDSDSLRLYSIDSGTELILKKPGFGEHYYTDVSIVGSRVYYTAFLDIGGAAPHGLYCFDISTRKTTTICDTSAAAYMAIDDLVYYFTGNDHDGYQLYCYDWLSNSNKEILQIDPNRTTPYTGLDEFSVDISRDAVYWADLTDHSIYCYSFDTQTQSAVLRIDNCSRIKNLQVNDDYILYEGDDTVICRNRLDGSVVIELADVEANNFWLKGTSVVYCADDIGVYKYDLSDSSISKIVGSSASVSAYAFDEFILVFSSDMPDGTVGEAYSYDGEKLFSYAVR